MRKNLLILIIIAILLFLFFSFFIRSCRCKVWHICPKDTTIVKWVDLNVLFKDNTDQVTRTRELLNIKRFITDTLSSTIPLDSNIYSVTIDPNSIRIDSCSCDSLLYNVTASLIVESGGSGSTPPQCKTDPNCVHPTGDALLTVSFNTSFKPETGLIQTNAALVKLAPKLKISDSALFAIIDSGIDSTLFEQPEFGKILWRGSGSLPRQRNFTNEGNEDDFSDKTSTKHGTAVAAIALQQFFASGTYPKIMILKIFNSSESTTIFITGCALKYAVEHKANLINASWGYSGPSDPVLAHYIHQATRNYKPIPVIAAAGNINVDPSATYCANPVTNATSLDVNPFYPACYSDSDRNVVSVTGMNGNLYPCYYQNYSPRYVTLAVKNDPLHNPCCGFKLPYLNDGYFMTGSSFATPVISGQIQSIMMADPSADILTIINRLGPKPITVPPPVTAKRGYIDY